MTVFKARNIAAVLSCAWVISCAELPRHKQRFQVENVEAKTAVASSVVLLNINAATAAELERLPEIGAGFAARIVEHRSRFGAFRRKEHLLMVRGMGERRYEAIESLIVVR